MPSQPLSRATTLGIVAVNLLILLLWKFPPAWRILNRYFICTPGEPRALSHLGNVFSHQSFPHLTVNMAVLYLIGEQLHEQIGRGAFLALYVTSGVCSSVISMTSFILRNILVSSSLGASGAVTGVVAAFCLMNPKYVIATLVPRSSLFFCLCQNPPFTKSRRSGYMLTFIVPLFSSSSSSAQITTWLFPSSVTDQVPPEYRRYLSCDASMLLAFLVVFELVSMGTPFLRSKRTDYISHLGGYVVGGSCGLLWTKKHQSGADGGAKGAERNRKGSDEEGREAGEEQWWPWGNVKWHEKILGK